jgi:hypothetical protein
MASTFVGPHLRQVSALTRAAASTRIQAIGEGDRMKAYGVPSPYASEELTEHHTETASRAMRLLAGVTSTYQPHRLADGPLERRRTWT